jgi:two-component system cell cycle response regulator
MDVRLSTMSRNTLIPADTQEEQLKVLIADDELESRQGLEMAVRSLGHSCAVARDGLEAWEMFQADRPDVLLADWNMPKLDGIGLCRRIRGEVGARYTHFIFVTGKTDKVHFLEGMHAGADDYITKPVDLDELELRARRHPCSAAICDIDAFKDYNDCYGHLAGDDVLRRFAQTIRNGLRQVDGFYRYGGEEFLAILSEQSISEAAAGMDRVRKLVEELRIVHAPKASTPFVTISVGIAQLNPDSGGGTEDWLRRADASLYRAKTMGRNRVVREGSGEARAQRG